MPARMGTLEQRIERVEAVARRLEPDASERAEAERAVLDYARGFLDGLPTLPGYRGGAPAGALHALPVRDAPYPVADVLRALASDVDGPGINPASGGHVGYIPGGGQYHAALGDYLADVFNRYAGVAFASPGAVRLEKSLIRWMADLVGFPAGAAGDLTSGGSVANLMGVVAARDARGVTGAEIERSVVYHTAQMHHCVDKAIRIAGLGACPRRHVAVDDRFRMDPDALDAAVAADRAAGLRPWLVVASAGTTDTGAVDPQDAVADVAARHGLWFHCDAAYGGFFVLTEHGRRVLAGLGRADSIVIDPHKGLFLPYGSGAVLVRDATDLHRAHAYHADYMQDAVTDESELSPADLSPELSRPFRGLRMWLPLMLCGLEPFRAALEEKLLLARHFHARLSSVPGFEVGPEPELSVVTYRYVPERGDADELNRRLVAAIHEDGRIFVSSTRVRGAFTLRLAVLNFRTHREHVDLLLELLQHHGRRLARS